MATTKRLEANRANALHSTGPKTPEGVLVSKTNALRHGLRALQTVVPGENPEEWEAHRAAVVDDLAPQGAVETALAEQVAAKLWRLGRVVRHETDLIANAQDPEELAHDHEGAHDRGMFKELERTGIPTRKDVAGAKKAADKAAAAVEQWEISLRTLEVLAGMEDGELMEDWSIYEPLKQALRMSDRQSDGIFKDDEEPFVARHVRAMLKLSGPVDATTESIATHWRDEMIPELRGKAKKARRAHQGLRERYQSALERRRRANGLPPPADTDRIQRYEAHLERGLHKALERLHALQGARRGLPPPPPSVTVALVQTGAGAAAGGLVGSFGSFAPPAIEASGTAGVATEG